MNSESTFKDYGPIFCIEIDEGDSNFRLVLSVCSPHFRHMLTNAPAGHHPIIFLNNVHPADFERLLQFMYYGEVRIPNGDLVWIYKEFAKKILLFHERCILKLFRNLFFELHRALK